MLEAGEGAEDKLRHTHKHRERWRFTGGANAQLALRQGAILQNVRLGNEGERQKKTKVGEGKIRDQLS